MALVFVGILLCFVALATPGLAEEHKGEILVWTAKDGQREIHGSFVSFDGELLVVRPEGQSTETRIGIGFLSEDSIGLARKLAAERKALHVGGEIIKPGQIRILSLPILNDEIRADLSKSYGKPTTMITIGMIIPEGFDASSPDSMAVICHSTTNGKALSVPLLGKYKEQTLAAGMALFAVDGEFGKPPAAKDTPRFRAKLVWSMIGQVQKDTDAAADWGWIQAGHSGGAGYASFMACYLTKGEYRVPGVFLSGGGYSPAGYEDSYRIPQAFKRKLPVYFSWGKNDKICTPQIQQQTMDLMRKSNFRNHRFEFHELGHGMSSEHFADALAWILAESG